MSHHTNPQYTTEPYNGRYNEWLDGLRNKPTVYATYEEVLAAQAVHERLEIDEHVDSESFADPEPFQFDEDRQRYYPSLLPALEAYATDQESDGDQSTPVTTPSSSASRAESSASTAAPQNHAVGAAAPAAEGNVSTTEPRKLCPPTQDDSEDAAGTAGQGEAPTATAATQVNEDEEQSASNASVNAGAAAEARDEGQGSSLLDMDSLPSLLPGPSDDVQTTPALSSTRSDSRPESCASSDPQTPGSPADRSAMLSDALNRGDDSAAAAVLNTLMLESEEPQAGADVLESEERQAGTDALEGEERPLPSGSEDGKSVAALLQSALQGDDSAAAAVLEIVSLAMARPEDEGRKEATNSKRKRVHSSLDEDEGEKQATARKKRGRPATRAERNSGFFADRRERAAQSRPAWRGPSPSQASSSASTSSQAAVSAAPLIGEEREIKWQEEGGPSRIIKEYGRLQQPHIDWTANSILALPPHAAPSQLPPRRYRTASERAVIRSLGQASSIKRRASIADPRFEPCEQCEHDYGLKNEPIKLGRMGPHKTEYHSGRMCSVCGLPVSGRETESSVKHRKQCAPWLAMVRKGFYKAWLRAHGFYGDKESEREFWKDYQRARAETQANGNEELRIQLLESELEHGEVRALLELMPAQTQATASTSYTQQQTGATARNADPASQPRGNASTVYPMPAQRVLDANQAHVAQRQHWTAPSQAGPSQSLLGHQASSSMAPPAAPMLYQGGLQAPGHRGQPHAFSSVYYHSGAPYPYDAGQFDGAVRIADGAADQVRHEPASANTVADSARSTGADAVPSAQGTSHLGNGVASDDPELTQGYSASWDDDEYDLYA